MLAAMSGEPMVAFAQEEALATATLNPPLNLIGRELIDDLLAAIDQAEAASGRRALVLRGVQSGVADAAFAGR